MLETDDAKRLFRSSAQEAAGKNGQLKPEKRVPSQNQPITTVFEQTKQNPNSEQKALFRNFFISENTVYSEGLRL